MRSASDKQLMIVGNWYFRRGTALETISPIWVRRKGFVSTFSRPKGSGTAITFVYRLPPGTVNTHSELTQFIRKTKRVIDKVAPGQSIGWNISYPAQLL